MELEALMRGKLHYPYSVNNFKSYLINVEHSVENFHFYQWYIDYTSRYYQTLKSQPQTKYRKESVRISMDYTQLNSKVLIPESLPFKEEIELVMLLFLYSNAKWELNIPYNLKAKLLVKLQNSTEPKQFNEVFNHIYNLLKNSSLKSFAAHINGNHIANSKKPLIVSVSTFVLNLALLILFSILRLRDWKWLLFPVWSSSVLMFLFYLYNVNMTTIFSSKYYPSIKERGLGDSYLKYTEHQFIDISSTLKYTLFTLSLLTGLGLTLTSVFVNVN